MGTPVGAYQETNTLGKSQVELVLQIYDGAIAELQFARERYEKNDFTRGALNLERAERMLTHLYTTLDMDDGGEVAVNLGMLYVWIIGKLHEVRATKAPERFEECLRILRNLREGWVAIRDASAPTRPTGAATPTTAERLEMVG
jgi:flagellar protein FliS